MQPLRGTISKFTCTVIIQSCAGYSLYSIEAQMNHAKESLYLSVGCVGSL